MKIYIVHDQGVILLATTDEEKAKTLEDEKRLDQEMGGTLNSRVKTTEVELQ